MPPRIAEQAELAGHAIRLAKLDQTIRRGDHVDLSFDDAAQDDIEELLALLAIVPFQSLLHDEVLILNPTFEMPIGFSKSSEADLICGNKLLDFKTTKNGSIQVKYLDQLLGYLLI